MEGADETDTHITKDSVAYVISGRDMLGQLVDNSSVDSNNRIVNTTQVTLNRIAESVIQDTRIPAEILFQQVPNVQIIFNTNAGETKINTLQSCTSQIAEVKTIQQQLSQWLLWWIAVSLHVAVNCTGSLQQSTDRRVDYLSNAVCLVLLSMFKQSSSIDQIT